MKILKPLRHALDAALFAILHRFALWLTGKQLHEIVIPFVVQDGHIRQERVYVLGDWDALAGRMRMYW